MSDQLSLGQRIEIVAKSVGSQERLAALIGVSDKTIWNYVHDRTQPPKNRLQAIARHGRVHDDWLAFGTGPKNISDEVYPPKAEMSAAEERLRRLRESTEVGHVGFVNSTIPVHGLAAGSALGHLSMTDDPIEFVSPPPGLLRVPGAYALIVTGASMEPKYTSGEMIFVHPARPINKGDHVVVQEARDGGLATLVKRFERQTADHLHVSQYNPLANIQIDRRSVTAMHRILTTNELFGI